MEKEIQFETLIDVRSDAFADYWSSISGLLEQHHRQAPQEQSLLPRDGKAGHGIV